MPVRRELALEFAREAPDFLQVFAGEHELQRFAALALHHRVGRRRRVRRDLGQLLAQDGQQFLLRDLSSARAACVRRPVP